MTRTLAVLIAALFSGACASPDAVSASESPSTREYPTGSNLPRKPSRDPKLDGVSVHSREDLERMQRGGNTLPARNPGGTP